MRKLILHIAMTIDGVAAPEDPSVFDHADDVVWRDLFATLENVDAVLIGARMHREYLSHWKAAAAKPDTTNEGRYGVLAQKLPHFVLSRTLKALDGDWPNASILEGGVAGITSLMERPGRDVMMWGGPTAAAAAIQAGVVDDLHLVTHPAIAGAGKKLFDAVTAMERVRLMESIATPSGIQILKYARA